VKPSIHSSNIAATSVAAKSDRRLKKKDVIAAPLLALVMSESLTRRRNSQYWPNSAIKKLRHGQLEAMAERSHKSCY
jgi:hypothetical protein